MLLKLNGIREELRLRALSIADISEHDSHAILEAGIEALAFLRVASKDLEDHVWEISRTPVSRRSA
jgi:hypothetical protein